MVFLLSQPFGNIRKCVGHACIKKELAVNILYFYSSLYNESRGNFLPQSNFQNLLILQLSMQLTVYQNYKNFSQVFQTKN